MPRLPEPRENVIYGLECTCHPGRGYRYIGLTTAGAQRRLWSHRKMARNGNTYPVYRWMRKHGDENVRSVVLERHAAPELLPDAERRVIAEHRSLGPADLNVTSGGEGTFGRKLSAEHLKLLSKRMHESNIGTHRTADSFAAMAAFASQRMSDPTHMEEHRRKVREKWASNPEMRATHARSHSPLTDEDVVAIREIRAETGAPYPAIANLLLPLVISEKTIAQICRRERWKHVA